METNEPRCSRKEQSYGQGGAGDARPHPPAVPPPVRKTFLVDHTESHSDTQSAGGSMWSVKTHDFGSSGLRARGERLTHIRAGEASRASH